MSSNNALCLPLTLSPCTVWPVSTHLLLTLLTPAVCTLSPFSHTLYVPVQREQGSHTFVVNFVHAYGVHSFSFQMFFCRFILPHHFVSQIWPFYNFRAWTLFWDQSCLKLTQAPYHHDVFCCTIQTAPASQVHSLTHMKEGIQSESILCFGILMALQQRHSNTRLL